jgi:hypothetical protein
LCSDLGCPDAKVVRPKVEKVIKESCESCGYLRDMSVGGSISFWCPHAKEFNITCSVAKCSKYQKRGEICGEEKKM